jgi:hypothetical protein
VVGGLGCGWAKLNVVFLCRKLRWQNTSFNFAKRWYFAFPFSVRLLSVVSVFRVSANGLQLKEVGDFYHKCSYEERMIVPLQNCHTKHRTANFF